MDKKNVQDLIVLLKAKEDLEKKIDRAGKIIHGNCFVDAHIEDGVITMYTESGHDWECDEWQYDLEGNEIDD